MKSLAAIAWRAGDPWTIEEIEVDPPGPDEVVVRWTSAGLCHSDEGFRSGFRLPPEAHGLIFPMLGGHEGAGVVEEAGPGVTALREGDHVTATFAPACGRCRYCTSGRAFLCNDNKNFAKRGQLTDSSDKHRAGDAPLYLMGKLGTFAERTTVSVASVTRVDPQVPLDAACLVSCGVATGWGSAVKRAGTQPGDVVVVVGLGGLGVSAVQGARMCGALEIIGVDPFELRRAAAEKYGASHTTASIEEARPIIRDLTDGQGADRVILTAGVVTPEMVHDGLDITGKGCVCVITGMGPVGESQVPIDIGSFALLNKELRGCLFGSLDPRSASEELLNLYKRGLLDLDSMITSYSLHDINAGFADSLGGRIIRGVVNP